MASRRSKRTKPRDTWTQGHIVEHWSTCLCGKRGLTEKRAARAMARRLRRDDPNGSPLRAYLCETPGGRWHIGHDHGARGANLNDPRLRFE